MSREHICDIVIPVLDQLKMTKRCIEALMAKTALPYGLILIDNGSTAETKRYLEDVKKAHAHIVLIRNEENAGWVKALNQGIEASSAGYICAMNNDAIVMTEGWLSKLIDIAESEQDIGLINPTFEIKNKERFLDAPFVEVDFCRGYCVVIKRRVIDEVGLFDEAYGIGYYDDDDYSVRAIRAGFRCVRAQGVFVEHLKDSTFTTIFEEEKRRKLHLKNKLTFYAKWGRRLRLLFIVSGNREKADVLRGIFFSLARHQHVIYLWNLTEPFGCRHINIREKRFPSFTPAAVFLLELLFNGLKKRSKKYDAIFVEKESARRLLSLFNDRVFRMDASGDGRDLLALVDTITEETKRESAASLEAL